VLLDGIVQPGATVGDQRVDLPAGSLCLDRPRTLHEESVGKVVDKIPGLRRALRKTPLSIRDDKWCASGTCRLNGESPLRGWAIHETVWFR
jgi:hypothetical protein